MKTIILASVAAAAVVANFGAANAQMRPTNDTHISNPIDKGTRFDYDTRSGFRAGS